MAQTPQVPAALLLVAALSSAAAAFAPPSATRVSLRADFQKAQG